MPFMYYIRTQKEKETQSKQKRPTQPPPLLRKCRPIHSLLRPHPFQRKEKEGKETKNKGENETASQTFRKRPLEDHRRPGTTEKKKWKCIGAEHTTHPYPTTMNRRSQKGKRGKQRGESDLPKKIPVVPPNALNPKP